MPRSTPHADRAPQAGRTHRHTHRRGPRGDVDRARIVAAARAVLGEAGLAGVSTRSVARQAGISPNAIYTYAEDMGDLLNAVGDEALAALDLGLLDGPDARASVRAFVEHAWATLTADPGLTALLASRRIVGPHALALNERLLAALVGAGLPPVAAADGVYALTAWLYGHLVCTVPDEADAAIERALRGLDPADFPLTAAARPSEDDLTGLEVVLDGVFAARGR